MGASESRDGAEAEKESGRQRQQWPKLSEERSCAEALMMACDERLGAQSPAALMVCDTFLARDFWTSFVHQSFPPPAASEVWAWGTNRHGQLGVGTQKLSKKPTEVTALHGRCIHAVACGGSHTMAVVDDGELWAAGDNGNGQLGLGRWSASITFSRVMELSGRKVAAVACGNYHTLVLLESGVLLSCGFNFYGELGLGDRNKRTILEPVAAFSGRRVAAIVCGGWHSLALLESGRLFTWGYNFLGQLGVGDTILKHSTPEQVAALAGMRVVAVSSCFGYHTAAVLESGELFTWGWNEQGQLGHGDLTESKNTPQLVEALRGRPVIAVACGNLHTLALLKTGEVFAWGRNDEGQLGLCEVSGDPISTPQQVHFFDGMRVKSVHASRDFSAVVLKGGELFTCGDNEYGRLGHSSGKKAVNTPTLTTPGGRCSVLTVSLGTEHAVALFR